MCARHGHDFMGCKSPVRYLGGCHIDTFKSTSRWQGEVWRQTRGKKPECKPVSQRTESVYKAEPQGESAQHDEAHPDRWGRVNAAVVQGKIMFLPGEICPALRPPLVGALHAVMHGVTGQKSAEDENLGFALEKGPKAV